MGLLPEPGAPFLVLEWPDGAAVFDRSTGDTHALEPVSAFLMRNLAPGEPLSEPVMVRCAEVLCEPLTAGFRERVRHAFAALADKGLIQSGAD